MVSNNHQWCLLVNLAHFCTKNGLVYIDSHMQRDNPKADDSTQEFSLTCGRFISKCNAPVAVCEYSHLEMVY